MNRDEAKAYAHAAMDRCKDWNRHGGACFNCIVEALVMRLEKCTCIYDKELCPKHG